MKIIVFTNPEYIVDESEMILRLLECGIDYIHIRKPGSPIDKVRNLILEIPTKYHNKLRLHEHFSLVNEFDLAGVQLNSKNRIVDENIINKTKSCHSIEEIHDTKGYEYITLSPIFDSISKENYLSQFSLNDLRKIIKDKRIVALGGVEPKHFQILKENNFWGAAMLGYVWKDATIKNIDYKINEILNFR